MLTPTCLLCKLMKILIAYKKGKKKTWMRVPAQQTEAMCRPRGVYSETASWSCVMNFNIAELNGIQCHLRWLLSQGIIEGYSRRNTRMFGEECWSVQAWNCSPVAQENVGLVRKEGGAGESIPLCKARHCAGMKTHSRHCGKIVVGVQALLQGNLLSVARLFKFITSEVKREEIAIKGKQLKATADHSTNMAPRQRATSRRGRNYGQRGQSGGRGIQIPRRVSPLAYASPSSFGSEDSGNAISNTVQSAMFKYKCRTNRPIISALITVIFNEEDEEEDNGKEESEEKEHSSDNSSQRRGKEDSSYLPSSQSRLEEDSSCVQSEEQNEVLQEIVSIMAQDDTTMAQQSSEGPQATEASRKNKEPDVVFGHVLYPKLPQGIHRLEDIPDGMEVTCELDPEREGAEWEAAKRAAADRAE
jgi:hypothetical protein